MRALNRRITLLEQILPNESNYYFNLWWDYGAPYARARLQSGDVLEAIKRIRLELNEEEGNWVLGFTDSRITKNRLKRPVVNQ